MLGDIGSYMTPIDKYLRVYQTENIHVAFDRIKRAIHQGGAWQGEPVLVVLDEGDKPVGLVTIKTLLKAAALRMLENDPEYRAEFSSWYFIKAVRAKNIPIREIMRPFGEVSLQYDQPLIKALKPALHRHINYIPIMKDGRVIGILSPRKIIYNIGDFKEVASLGTATVYKNKGRLFSNIRNAFDTATLSVKKLLFN